MGGYMSTPAASLADIVTGYGQQKANIASTQAQVPLIQAQTAREQELTRQGAQLTRQAELENQARELAVRDNGIIRDAMTNTPPVTNEDPAAYLGRITDYARRNGISAGGYIGLTKNLAGALETSSKLKGEALTQHKEALAQAGSLIDALNSAATPADQEAIYAREKPALDKLEPGFYPDALPADPAERKSLIGQWVAGHNLTGVLLGRQETQQTIATKKAEQAAQEASTASTQQKTEEEAYRNAAGKLATATDQGSYEKMWGELPAKLATKFPNPSDFNPQSTPGQLRNLGMTAEQQTQASQAAATAAETKRHNQAEESVARSKEHREQQIYDQTYGEGSNEALRGVEPRLRVPATKEAQAAADEHAKAVEATNNMQSFIDLARSGNKVAYAYAPVTGVLTINTAAGVKRVNMPEIKSYGGAGSMFDKAEGWLKGHLTGESIPKDILDAMEGVNHSIEDGAANTYNSKIKSVNQNYHANFKPVEMGGHSAAAKTAQGGYQVGHLYSGMEYLGGDPNKQENWKQH